MAIGGAIGGATAGLGVAANKVASGARRTLGAGAKKADDLADDAAGAGRQTDNAGGGGSCPVPWMSFDPETPVLLDKEGATEAIGRIKLGQKVLATDPVTGITEPRPVTALYSSEDLLLADVTVVDDDRNTATIHTTQNHPFWNATTRTWTEAADLRTGDKLRTDDGDHVEVVAVLAFTQPKWMVNLGVDEPSTYYVLADGIPVLVHNRPWLADVGYSNYTLVNQSGQVYYSGMYGPKQSSGDVERRHAGNRNRFNPANGDRLVPVPGTRTYGEARLMEQRLADLHGTYIGRDGDNYRGNRQQPMSAAKRPAYEAWEAGRTGGCR